MHYHNYHIMYTSLYDIAGFSAMTPNGRPSTPSSQKLLINHNAKPSRITQIQNSGKLINSFSYAIFIFNKSYLYILNLNTAY